MALVIKESVPLHNHTTLQVGGEARYWCSVANIEELSEALLFAKAKTTTPPLILGAGSNVLIGDEGYGGLVIHIGITGRVYTEQNDNVVLQCGAGEIFDDIIKETVQKKLWGLENLSDIPGTVGATPVQNVGAYGVEVSDLILGVSAVHVETNEHKDFNPNECAFTYRDSFFKTEEGRDWIITSVTFQLQKNGKPNLTYADLHSLHKAADITPETIRAEIKNIRSKKFPDWHTVGTAGSFFKNPIITKKHYDTLLSTYADLPGFAVVEGIKISLGYVLDKICGLRGYQNGNVGLYKNQALVLVVDKNATTGEIKKFISEVTEKVFSKTKIKIEPEVRIL